MPDTGAPWHIPYPLGTDPPDDPGQSQARAERIHAELDVATGYDWNAARYGLAAWSGPLDAANANVASPAGRVWVFRLRLPVATTIHNIVTSIGVVGAGLTAGQNFAGIYSVAGNLLASTDDQSVAWTTLGLKVMALTTPVAMPAGDFYIGLLTNGTTPPQFPRGIAQHATLTNLGMDATNGRSILLNAFPVTVLPPTFGTGGGLQGIVPFLAVN